MTNSTNKYLVLSIAIVAGVTGAWLSRSTPSTGTVTATRTPKADSVQPNIPFEQREPGHTDSTAQATAISGKVLETINVPNYTYLRLESPNSAEGKASDGTWVAVPTATIAVGQVVTLKDAQRMDNFESKTLKRSFPVIYFGELGDGRREASKLPAGHPDISGKATTAGTDAKDGPMQGAENVDMAAMHGAPTAGASTVSVGVVERAPGDLGRTVAELVRDRKNLEGKKVRIRGVVVKSTSGVLNRTFIHVRDGSGIEKSGDHDVTITTTDEVAVGSKAIFEGTVVTDKDFGSGYKYPVLLENARKVNE